MPDLLFRAGELEAVPYAAVPTIAARVNIVNLVKDEPIQSVLLSCQVQLQPLGRTYSPAEEMRLLDLFGERESWGRTMNPLHWMNVVLKVPGFTGETAVDLPLPCSFDFDVAANKYFYGLEAGSIAMKVMFSGTVFYPDEQNSMRIAQIPWDREVRFHLPVELWKRTMDAHYGNCAWLRVTREIFDRLYLYKTNQCSPTWDAALERLLNLAEDGEDGDDAARQKERTNDLRFA